MAEPPFQMPGHRWDPDKKRFFKILPGQSANHGSGRNTSSTSLGASSSTGRSNRKNHEQNAPAEQYFAATPHLPALQLFDPTQKTILKRSPFSRIASDPVTVRQQGRMPVALHQNSEQRRIEAAYSRLALCNASTPSAGGRHSPKIIAMQTDADGQSLFLLDAVATITRFSPLTGLSETVFSRMSEPGPGFMARGCGALWHGSSGGADGTQHALWYLPLQHEESASVLDAAGQTASLPRYWATGFMDSNPLSSRRACIRYDTLMRSHGPTSWAMREAALHQTGDVENPAQVDKAMYFAVSTLKTVQVYVINPRPPALGFHGPPRVYEPAGSDITATAFDLSGHVLYCGTRSGLVLAWEWRNEPAFRSRGQRHVSTVLKGEGSVTNLQAVSSDEIVVVRINGHVELVDVTDRHVKRRFEGHVNAYNFNLGFALDAELRLLALAGLDRKVRVWSLSSPFPLGTSTPTLPSVYCPPCSFDYQVGQASDNSPSDNLYDRTHLPMFARDHPSLDGKPGLTRGSTLSSVSFPHDITALHWHPRSVYEGCDPHEAHVLQQGPGASFCQPQHRWKDLFVAAGKYLYHFRWP